MKLYRLGRFFAIQDKYSKDFINARLWYFTNLFQCLTMAQNQKIIPLSDVEIGINYAIIITTNGSYGVIKLVIL